MTDSWPSRVATVLASWKRARLEMAESQLGSERYEHARAEAIRCAEEYVRLQAAPPALYKPLEHEAADATVRSWLDDPDRI